MEQLQLFNLSLPDGDLVDGTLIIRANVWLMSSEEIPPLLVTVEEGARLLALDPSAVDELIEAGSLRSVMGDGVRRVPIRALGEYVASLEES